jgi:cyanophycinase
VPVASRADASNPALVELIAGAGLIYLSGGHPTFLADTLRDTPVWTAIVAAWQQGAALAGCSAGAMALASWVPSIRHPRGDGGVVGLGLLPHLRVIPHYDAYFSRVPDVAQRFLAGGNSGATVIGVDEETALVGGPHEWRVEGASHVWLLDKQGRTPYGAGQQLTL